jgi:acyl dehydratase
MSSAAERAHSILKPQIGVESAAGEWHRVTQDQIDAFAKTTLDRQFIHTDPVRAAQETPFGVTIAHGFLTLSLISYLVKSIAPLNAQKTDAPVMGINYGLDRVRFPSPVRVNSRVRARQVLLGVEAKDEHTLQLTHRITVEIESESKPGCVAEWVTRAIYA